MWLDHRFTEFLQHLGPARRAQRHRVLRGGPEVVSQVWPRACSEPVPSARSAWRHLACGRGIHRNPCGTPLSLGGGGPERRHLGHPGPLAAGRKSRHALLPQTLERGNGGLHGGRSPTGWEATRPPVANSDCRPTIEPVGTRTTGPKCPTSTPAGAPHAPPKAGKAGVTIPCGLRCDARRNPRHAPSSQRDSSSALSGSGLLHLEIGGVR